MTYCDLNENPELHLKILKEVTLALGDADDLEELIASVLKLLKKYAGMKQGTVSIVDPSTHVLSMEVSEGLPSKHRPGEKIIQMVVKSGRPVAIPSVGDEPLWLDKTTCRKELKEIAFLCVPIKATRVIGALSVDAVARPSSFDRELRLLEILSSIIAQAYTAHQNIESRQLKAEMKEKFHPQNMIGNDKRMLEVYEQIHHVEKSDITVLLYGESGTGKELIANAVHYNSSRAAGPIVKINCAALPEALLESELFGHEKGAFTGAFESKPGRFELASGGTLFLDEVSELSLFAQSKLLRAIQEKEIDRVGGKKPIKVNVRLIAASNKDLADLVKRGAFRADLFYRLNVYPVFLPPLRERRSDIPLLVDHFLEKFAKRDHKPIRRIATSAIDMLMAYHWPGNVRELENCIERAVLICKGGVVQSHHLPPTLQTAEASHTAFKGTLKNAVEAYEKDLICDALKSSRGNITKAAQLLGSTPRIIGYKVEQYKIKAKTAQ